MQDTASRSTNRIICSPEYETSKDRDKLTMVTFYDILNSVQFTTKDNTWVKSVENESDDRDQERYHLLRVRLETGKKH